MFPGPFVRARARERYHDRCATTNWKTIAVYLRLEPGQAFFEEGPAPPPPQATSLCARRWRKRLQEQAAAEGGPPRQRRRVRSDWENRPPANIKLLS